MARRRDGNSFWQSYADLSMGVMAVMILVLIVILTQQSNQNDLFANELLKALLEAQTVVKNQDDVADWVGTVFEESTCQLSFNPKSGKLELTSGGADADLYEPGEVRVGQDAQRALESCARSFLILANCLATEGAPKDRCAALLTEAGIETDKVESFRDGIEALVLQGNTDRVPYLNASRIGGVKPRKASGAHREREAFVQNAQLGAERARQALGHLLYRVHYYDDQTGQTNEEALDLLMGRVRVESPSFGLFQAGRPPQEQGCRRDVDECSTARNLALGLRWRKESLRRPFSAVRQFFCKEWNNPASTVRSSLGDDNDARRLCESEGQAK